MSDDFLVGIPATLSWTERIQQAAERGGFTPVDKALAEDWVTCACGEQDAKLLEDGDGPPLDPVLKEHGVSFSLAVDHDMVVRAGAILAKIQERSAELLEGA